VRCNEVTISKSYGFSLCYEKYDVPDLRLCSAMRYSTITDQILGFLIRNLFSFSTTNVVISNDTGESLLKSLQKRQKRTQGRKNVFRKFLDRMCLLLHCWSSHEDESSRHDTREEWFCFRMINISPKLTPRRPGLRPNILVDHISPCRPHI